ncbi:uncharacterized protein BN654_00132 [Clostridium sp. CAG:433]|jgi:hypothetical protein|nr:uncharacterized protein BN654_00132 [Clostridium sp. CAG:433]HAX63170.1 hypothetical protein [Bacillota bacterium]
MLKKIFKISAVLLLVGFSFFYTEKVTMIARNSDPIMRAIKKEENNKKVSNVNPVINKDEYIMGINGCEIDVDKSYSKMRSVGEFKEELIVMKETSNDKDLTDKYVIGGNNKEKNVSLIFIVNKDIDSKLTDYINDKNIKVNYFIDGKYLEENMITVKFLSENSNIYYLGENEEYSDENMLYHNNLISMNGSNEPKYCFTSDKDNNTLKLCNDYDMVTIKSDIIKDNIYKRIKDKLNNGVIFAIDSDNIDEIKVSINYILSKGYNIISLEDLLSEKNECK